MPTITHQPAHAAAVIGVGASTLRGWCSEFGTYLSPTANPAPGTPRRLTDRDIAVLQRVAELRNEHLTYADIHERLQGEDLAALEPFVDSDPPTETTPITYQASPGVAESHPIALQVVERLAMVESRLEGLQHGQAEKLTWFVWGVLAGVLGVLAVAALFAVGLWAGG